MVEWTGVTDRKGGLVERKVSVFRGVAFMVHKNHKGLEVDRVSASVVCFLQYYKRLSYPLFYRNGVGLPYRNSTFIPTNCF